LDPAATRGNAFLLDRHGQPVSVDRWLNTRPLRHEVSTRPGPGNRKLTYYSGETVTRHLNEVFGYDGWNLDIKSVTQTDKSQTGVGPQQKWQVSYLSHVRITIVPRMTATANNSNNGNPSLLTTNAGVVVGTYREDYGAGDSTDKSLQTAVANAMKSSITDALKRTARHFGDRLGNSLYDASFKLSSAPLTLHQALDDYDKEQAKKCPLATVPQQQHNAAATNTMTPAPTASSSSYQHGGAGGNGPSAAAHATKNLLPTVTPAPHTAISNSNNKNAAAPTTTGPLAHRPPPPPPPHGNHIRSMPSVSQNTPPPPKAGGQQQQQHGRPQHPHHHQPQQQRQQHQSGRTSTTTAANSRPYPPPASQTGMNHGSIVHPPLNNGSNHNQWGPTGQTALPSNATTNTISSRTTAGGSSHMDPPRTAAEAMQSLFSSSPDNNHNVNKNNSFAAGHDENHPNHENRNMYVAGATTTGSDLGSGGVWKNNSNSLPERPSTAAGKRPLPYGVDDGATAVGTTASTTAVAHHHHQQAVATVAGVSTTNAVPPLSNNNNDTKRAKFNPYASKQI
jgi:hypothetical protein